MAFFYHVTYLSRLKWIALNGLPDNRYVGAEVYDADGETFLTNAGGVQRWATRAEEWAENRSDNLIADLLLPVLLRVRMEDAARCRNDEDATEDARHDVFVCPSKIPPDKLEVWIGVDDKGKWAPIKKYRGIRIRDAFDFKNDDGDEVAYLRDAGNGSPFIPHLHERNPRAQARKGPSRFANEVWLKPPANARRIAREALEIRGRLSAGKQGGTDAGVARARSIAAGELQPAREIAGWFARHGPSIETAMARRLTPLTSKALLAQMLWGGWPMLAAVEHALGTER